MAGLFCPRCSRKCAPRSPRRIARDEHSRRQNFDTPLAKIGGKGLFVKELERALLDGDADIAVHSMKDVPMAFPEGLGLAVICEREDPTDAFVSNRFSSLAQLPEGARVGTSSLRRQCQLRALRPDLKILDLRGNVGTRLGKLDADDYDAIILASAGLIRLELEERIAERLSTEVSLPAGGQGAVGIECRLNDDETLARLSCLHHADTAARVVAERAMNARLNGGCPGADRLLRRTQYKRSFRRRVKPARFGWKRRRKTHAAS